MGSGNLAIAQYNGCFAAVDPRLACSQCDISGQCLSKTIMGGNLTLLKDVIRRQRRIDKGQLLFQAGQTIRRLYVIRKGSIKCYTLSREGEERVCDFFLEGELIDLEHLNASTLPCFAVALEPTELCEIPIDAIRRKMDSESQLCRQLLTASAVKLGMQKNLHKLLTHSCASQCVADFLLSLVQRMRLVHPHRTRFRLSMARSDIASYLGLTTETVSRSVSQLCRQHSINIRGKWISLPPPKPAVARYAMN